MWFWSGLFLNLSSQFSRESWGLLLSRLNSSQILSLAKLVSEQMQLSVVFCFVLVGLCFWWFVCIFLDKEHTLLMKSSWPKASINWTYCIQMLHFIGFISLHSTDVIIPKLLYIMYVCTLCFTSKDSFMKKKCIC